MTGDRLGFGVLPLGVILVELGALNADGLRTALALQRAVDMRIGEALLVLGLVEQADVQRALDLQFQATGQRAAEKVEKNHFSASEEGFNRLGALVSLLLALPLMAIIAAAIKLDDGGPVLFRQFRVGRGGRRFLCLKFRTMREDSEEILMKWRHDNSAEWRSYVANNFKLPNDPRVLVVGRWLRRFSLDELPQLFNVLIGDMNLVGPRPLLPREIPDYGPSFAEYRQLKPGLTCLWQVQGRNLTTFRERVAADSEYFRRRSLTLNLRILLKTFLVVINGRGAS